MRLDCDKIICVGKNYLDHAKELGDAVPEKPVLFMKPASACMVVRQEGQTSVPLPFNHGAVHHELEIVVRIARDGYFWSIDEAEASIDAVTLGLDLTLRDLQTTLKKAGHPWEISKAFPNSAVIGPWLDAAKFSNYLETPFSLTLDGKKAQSALGSQMRLSPAECLAYASEHFALKKGDLLFTGTPAGVGPVKSGQVGVLEWGSQLKYSVKFTALDH
jgi:2-keto-4-pentenoate hydratase/2-oxohepta-3-ene-1,7-dioic acid hydratase in catechol pathway